MPGFADDELFGVLLLGDRKEDSLDVNSLIGRCSNVFQAGAQEHTYHIISDEVHRA
jgi:hypothetical protein